MRFYLPGRIPVDLWVDAALNIVKVDGALITPEKKSETTRKTPHEDPRIMSSDLGAVTKTREDGTVEIVSIDEKTKSIMPFFTDRPCWFSGCEELREKYRAEIEKVEKAAQDKKQPCRGCDKGEIMRKYITILRGLDLT